MNEYIQKYKVQPQPNLNTTLPGRSEENHKKSESVWPVLGNRNAKHTTGQLTRFQIQPRKQLPWDWSYVVFVSNHIYTNVCGIRTNVHYFQAQIAQSVQCACQRLDNWRITVWFLPWAAISIFLRTLISYGAHSASYSKCTRSHSPGVKREGMILTIHINIVFSLWTHCLHLRGTAASYGYTENSLLAENTNLTKESGAAH